jgi:hypothetical protein
MIGISEPSPENAFLGGHAELILSSLFRLTGRHLVDPGLNDRGRTVIAAKGTKRTLFATPCPLK